MLSKQTIERIEQEAIARYCSPYGKRNPETYAYKAGATAEATRHEQERKELVEALEKIATHYITLESAQSIAIKALKH